MAFCACGCGRQTPIAGYTNPERGHVRGRPTPYCLGHRKGMPFEQSYVADEATGCWEWQGSITSKGYGKIKRHTKTQLAHRVSYELSRGAIPSGMEIDYLCRNRRCVNPSHLEVVTHTENRRRRGWLSPEYLHRTRESLMRFPGHDPQGTT